MILRWGSAGAASKPPCGAVDKSLRYWTDKEKAHQCVRYG